jgi:hypothetical protein
MRAAGALAVLLPGSLLYLYKANAVPDHVWVTRRFLVSAFPMIVLLALGLAAIMSSLRSTTRDSRALRAGAVLIAIASVAYPVYTVVGVRSMTEETGYLGVVKDVCTDIGPHAATVVLENAPTDQLDDWIPQALRAWCGSDVAVTRGPVDPDALRRLAREWNAAGRPFFVASSSDAYIRSVLPDAQMRPTRRAVDTELLAPTLTHRPDTYRTEYLAMVVASIPAN